MTNMTIDGGDKLEQWLSDLGNKVTESATLRVGFLEGSTESKDGTPTPLVAWWNEFGYTQSGKSKDGLPTNTVVRPPRPFFRMMISQGKEHWGDDLAKLLKAHDYNTNISMQLLGEEISGELKTSIQEGTFAPLSPRTIAKKGFDKPLIDSGDMLNAVNYEVEG